MTPTRRALAAVLGGRTDYVPPANPLAQTTKDLMEFCGATWPKAHRDPVMMADLAAAPYEVCGIGAARPQFDISLEAEVLGCRLDWNKPDRPPGDRSRLQGSEGHLVGRWILQEGKGGGRLGPCWGLCVAYILQEGKGGGRLGRDKDPPREVLRRPSNHTGDNGPVHRGRLRDVDACVVGMLRMHDLRTLLSGGCLGLRGRDVPHRYREMPRYGMLPLSGRLP